MRPPFRVGEWSVEPLHGRITRGDRTVALRPRALAVLVCLADRAGELASKQHLIDTVWCAEFVSDNALTHVVAELRTALGDDPLHPAYIETIPRRGYRLVAAVELTPAAPRPSSGLPEEIEVDRRPPVRPEPRSRRRRLLWVAAVVLVVIGASITVSRMSERVPAHGVEAGPTGERGVEIRADRVVVIPFENRTGEHQLDAIGLMAADWVTQGLAGAAVLEVVPPARAHRAAVDASVPALDQALSVAHETGAGLVVSGSYYRLGDGLQLQVNVTDTLAGALLVALEPELGDSDDPMQLINRVRQRVVGAVAAHLDLTAPPVQLSRPPLFEAYQEHAAGSALTGRDYDRAMEHLERAVEIDPDFLAARFGIFVCNLVHMKWQLAREDLERLEGDVDRLTPYERLWLEWGRALIDLRFVETLHVMRKLLRLNPDDPGVLRMFGSAGIWANRPREVVNVLSAVDLRSYLEGGGAEENAGMLVYRLAAAHHLLGNHEAELEVARRGRELMPHRVWMVADELAALAALGRVEEVDRLVGVCLGMQDLEVESGWAVVETAEELRAHGHPDAALRLADRAVAWYRVRPVEAAGAERTRYGLGRALYLAERWSEAQGVFAALAAEHPEGLRFPIAWGVSYEALVGCAAARRGDRARASAALKRLESWPDPDAFHYLHRARIEALLGNRTSAVGLLREAYAQGLAHSLRIHRDPDLEGLRGYPPFDELIRPKG